MQLSEYASCDAVELASLIERGELTAKEVTALACAGIDAVNPQLNAVIEVFEDRRDGPVRGAGQAGPLFGVPILNKDLSFPEAGRRHEMGSVFAKGFRPENDSTTIEPPASPCATRLPWDTASQPFGSVTSMRNVRRFSSPNHGYQRDAPFSTTPSSPIMPGVRLKLRSYSSASDSGS